MTRRKHLIGALSLLVIAGGCRDSTSPSRQVAVAAQDAITSGDQFTCALDANGAATCWGADESGQLGTGTKSRSAPPAHVTGGHRFTQIAAAISTTCAVDVDGAVWCWGFNQGRLGNGDTAESAVPVQVKSDQRFKAVASGLAFCGLTTAGSVYCWGSNINGQLGNGTTSSLPSTSPVAVTGAPAFGRITGAPWGTCGLTAGGAAYCWGGDVRAQLGVAAAGTDVPVPTPMLGGLAFTDMRLGATVSCGIAGGSTYCWGMDSYGSLGHGTTAGTPTIYEPTAITTPAPFTSIFPGIGNNIFTPTCALTAGGAAYCWGANRNGQLGTTATSSTCTFSTLSFGCSGDPLPVSGSYSVKALSVGAEHVCGITTAHQVVCWGRNDFGQLGGGSTDSASAKPVIVPGLSAP